MSTSLGLIETVGLPAAIAAADTAAKSANVRLLQYELTKGGGLVTVKFEGDVGAVKAALEAAAAVASSIGEVNSKLVIPRPNEQLQKIIGNKIEWQVEEEIIDDFAIANEEAEKLEVAEPQEVEQQSETESEGSEDVKKLHGTVQVDSNRAEESEPEKQQNGKASCNLCHDPNCPRQKGDLRSECIHYKK
ncbi:BMC domain-containing protein [Ralstonia pickettii]|nr:BMC domain-containing protein [Ralstonia pickettii]